MNILVTGSAGMIGSHLVEGLLKEGYSVTGIDKKSAEFKGPYEHFNIDIGRKDSIEHLFSERKIDRVIHLAALAHAVSGKKYTKDMYEYMNVECANNIFEAASRHNIPVLFISTVDVFGFQKGVVNGNTECHPVTIYGKTKYKAEQLLKDSSCQYTIFRFSPVYTKEINRDIQKRYYLKYPNWAYLIGKGNKYEVLNVDKAINEMIRWCASSPNSEICIIKDDEPLITNECVKREKEEEIIESHIDINTGECGGCEKCIMACPNHVLELKDGKCSVRDSQVCKSCRICLLVRILGKR